MALLDSIMRDAVQTILQTVNGPGLIHRTVKQYDPLTGSDTETTTPYTPNISPPLNYNNHEVDGKTIVTGDVKFIVEAKGLTIELDPKTDKIIHAGVTWDIVRVKPVYSGAEIAAYIVQARL